MQKISLVISAFLFVSSFASARVIGFNDLLRVNGLGLNVPPKLHEAANSVGLMSQGCTGTHIGRGLVITAGHCFFSVTNGIVRDLPCPADQTIQWGVRGDRRGLISKCQRIIAMHASELWDWALFQVDRAPSASVEVETEAALYPGQVLTVFSHADEEPLHWSQLCRIVKPFPAPFGVKFLYHICDTNPGSSGASLIDARTYKIVGVHDGGDTRVNYGTPTQIPEIAFWIKRLQIQR